MGYQIANIRWIIEKAREFQKNFYFRFIDYAKAFDCVDHNKLWKFFKRWEYQTTWPASWEICMQVRKQQLELDMEQQTGSKSGKAYIKAVYCHPAYLTYMQEEKGTTEDEMAGWHHWLDGHESEWTPGAGDGQGGLACCDSWGHKESDMTERLNWNEQSTLWEMLGWMKHKLESRFPGEISITSDMQMTPSLWKKVKN